MGSDSVRLLVDSWAVGWSILLLLGYLAERTPWPGLRVLRDFRTCKVMVLASAALVLGLTLGGASEPSAVLTVWAILSVSVKWLYDNYLSENL